jgi:hypothetical protein
LIKKRIFKPAQIILLSLLKYNKYKIIDSKYQNDEPRQRRYPLISSGLSLTTSISFQQRTGAKIASPIKINTLWSLNYPGKENKRIKTKAA